MKTLIASLSICAVIVAGCTTAQQRTSYNTIFTLEQTTTVAVDDYYTLVIKGMVSTNGVPDVSKAYDSFQQAAALATIAAQNNTNALAPSTLVLEATQLGQLITALEK